jgi:hypothetical protein
LAKTNKASVEVVLKDLVLANANTLWSERTHFTPFLVARKGAHREHPYSRIGSTAEWYRYRSRLSSYPHVALRNDFSEKKAFFAAAIFPATCSIHFKRESAVKPRKTGGGAYTRSVNRKVKIGAINGFVKY